MDARNLRYADLFAGIGGMGMPLARLGARCVYASEIDRSARETHARNHHADVLDGRDIRDVLPSEIPDHDILLAGFPCQPFSSVRRKHPEGFADKDKGTLFHEIIRILQARRPKAYLLENVPRLVTLDHGDTLRTIVAGLRYIGYSVHWRIVCSSNFLPQKRERVYFAGYSDMSSFHFHRMRIPHARPPIEGILHDGSHVEAAYTDARGYASESYTLSDSQLAYLRRRMAVLKQRKGRRGGFVRLRPLSGHEQGHTLIRQYMGNFGSDILIAQEDKLPRRLTPRECSRYMGYDTGRESQFALPESDNAAYRQLGNGVAVPVVAEILRTVLGQWPT